MSHQQQPQARIAGIASFIGQGEVTPENVRSKLDDIWAALSFEEQSNVLRYASFVYSSFEVEEILPGELSPEEAEAIANAKTGEFVSWDELSAGLEPRR